MLAWIKGFVGAYLVACVALVVVPSGCSQGSVGNGTSGTANQASAMDTIGPWLRFIGNPQKVKQARDAYSKARIDRLNRVFAALGASPYIDSETMDLLEGDREGSLQKLSSLLNPDGVTDKSVGATLLLCRMHDARGRTYASRILRSGSAEQRRALLNGIGWEINFESESVESQDFLFADKELVNALLAQLDAQDEETLKAAIQCCGYLGVPGTSDRFVEMLRRSQVPDKSRILFWLSRGELTEDVFNVALEASKNLSPEDPWGASIFEACANSADEPLRTRAKDRLREILKSWPDNSTRVYSGRRLDILAAISNAADQKDLDWLSELLNRESGLYAAGPLAAYLRLSPEEGRKLLLQWLDDDNARPAAIDAAGKRFAKSADEEIVSALAARASVASGRELEDICNALSSIGGVAAQKVIETCSAKLDPASLSRFRQSFSAHSLEAIAHAIRAAGLLSEREIEAAIAQLTGQVDDRLPGPFEFLHAAGSAIEFDVETDVLPCRHDQLVLDFAKASRGRFCPEAVLEIWHQKDEDDIDSPYTLQFLVNQTLYQAEVRNFGDWYDVERVVQMVNAALSRQGASERFVGLAGQGQVAQFVFADQKRLSAIAHTFNIAVSDEFQSAMRQGIEYEQQAIERPAESDERVDASND